MTERRVSSLSWLAMAAMTALLYLVANGCGGSDATAPEATDPPPATSGDGPTLPPEPNPEQLSSWAQLMIEDDQLVLGEGVVAYDLNSALFSDYAHKLRTVWLPDGATAAQYDPMDVFDFPVGTVITKTFYYPTDGADPTRVLRRDDVDEGLDGSLRLDDVHLLETRVLVHRPDGWAALPYVWNDEQTGAELRRTGDLIPLTLVGDGGRADVSFTYVVPDANQCANCHATNHTTGDIEPIGPKARHLNTMIDAGDGPVAQLQRWVDLGVVGAIPDVAELPVAAMWDDDTAPLAERARTYLDINCAHCHNRVGPADTSGLFLEASTEQGPALGVCKAPIAAGRGTGGRLVGIEPGDPDASIFVFRMASDDPAEMMPELGRALVHDEGLALITAWIASLDGGCG